MKQFILTVDASKRGIGAVLSQRNDEGDDLPIAFASSGFSKADQNKAPIYQELLAIYFGIKHFRPYLYGSDFIVRSDHKPLSYLFSMKDPTTKFARIRHELTAYNFTIEHIKGLENVAADALSRIEFNAIKNCEVGNQKVLAITRSKTKELDDQPQSSEVNKACKVKNPISNEHIRKFPLVIFSTNDFNELSFAIRGRHRVTSSKLPFDPRNAGTSMRCVLAEVDNICLGKGIKEIHISNDDRIFDFVSKQEFSKVAEDALKFIHIWIMPDVIEIFDIEKQGELIRHHHDHHLEGGLAGQKRLYSKLSSLYKWKGLSKQIVEYLKKCDKCRTNKPRLTNIEPLKKTPTPTRPFQSISIDTIGPFPTTTNQAKYAITVICEFSKYLIICPIPNKESVTIAKELLNSVLLTFSHVERIRSDLGTEYVNKVLRDLTLLLDIQHLVHLVNLRPP